MNTAKHDGENGDVKKMEERQVWTPPDGPIPLIPPISSVQESGTTQDSSAQGGGRTQYLSEMDGGSGRAEDSEEMSDDTLVPRSIPMPVEENFWPSMNEHRLSGKILLRDEDAPDEEKRAAVLLEGAIAAYCKSDEKDTMALHMIVEGLIKTPLYMPFDVNVKEMLQEAEGTKIEEGDVPGDMVIPGWDVKMKMHMIQEEKRETIPLYTSRKRMEERDFEYGLKFSPQEYLSRVLEMGKDVVINYGNNYWYVVLEASFIREVLWPRVKAEGQI